MGGQKPEKVKKQICAGLLAHVDAGKTTLSERLLYAGGTIRKKGRVDNKDTFLDNHELERARGITIFSKQASFTLGETRFTLLDTPGHVDFSAEMERTLQVLDYAVLIVSGADGVQGHTETLWKLLRRYEIPVFLFVNKMDQEGTDQARLMEELKQRLDDRCVDFHTDRSSAAFLEDIAVCAEEVLEQYVETGTVETEQIRELIRNRQVFPCYFGSALKDEDGTGSGLDDFLQGMEEYMLCPEYGSDFGARVYKISRDRREPEGEGPACGRRGRGAPGGKGERDPAVFRRPVRDGERGGSGDGLRRHRPDEDLSGRGAGSGAGLIRAGPGTGADV